MPFCLEERGVMPKIENYGSVLIVPCRFCPAASTVVKRNKPSIEFLRRSLKTASYEWRLAWRS
jgi:hypothetical protein